MTYIHSPYSVDQTHKMGRLCTPRVFAVLQGTTTAPDPRKPLHEMIRVSLPPPTAHTGKIVLINKLFLSCFGF